ncbi:CD83 antigen [Seriola lalandi dorsalis]|uniref:CD83 molecule n=1 Tax=Seriola lalandi dorsalis TaxID=1841481 RepID=A0A3B4WP01_SERLL|nr:CD83 antigen [Seriola lalandi dorsalis]
MYRDHIFFTLLTSLCVCLSVEGAARMESIMEVKSVTGEDCTLECTAVYKEGVDYRAVRWYKVLEPTSSQLSGLLTRDLPNGTTRWYAGVDREVELLGESRNILLPNVTCGDSGSYICHLAAPVGEQNREGTVVLTVTDCSTEKQMTDTYLVIFASALLMLALLIFLISYGSLRNVLRDRSRPTKKDVLLDAPLKPLEKKDLMLIYTLGPKSSTTKHIFV